MGIREDEVPWLWVTEDIDMCRNAVMKAWVSRDTFHMGPWNHTSLKLDNDN